MIKHLSALALLLCSAMAPASAAEPAAVSAPAAARPPLAYYARLPQVTGVSLSPDGRQVAAMLNQPQGTVLVTRLVDGDGAVHNVIASDNVDMHIRWVRWVSNDRLLISVAYASRRGHAEVQETRLLSIKSDGSDMQTLDNVGRNAQLQDQVLDMQPGNGKQVLLQQALPQLGTRLLPAVLELNVETAKRRVVTPPQRDVYRWVVDAQHRVRVGVRGLPGQRRDAVERGPDGGDWRTLWTADDARNFAEPLGFGADPQALYVRALHDGRMAVFLVRLDDPKLTRQLVMADPERDVDGTLMVAPVSGEVIGVRVDGDDGVMDDARVDLWSPTWRTTIQSLDRALPGSHARLLQLSHDGQRYLVYVSGNGRPGSYYVGDRRSGQLTIIGDTYPELAGVPLAGKQPQRLTARDGLTLRSYLTLPAGRKLDDGGVPLPLVLLPHGGPASRDSSDFDAWTEMLASRGMAVLQVNFRGSSGYGQSFLAAGFQRWGLEMQDDLADAVAWAVGRGLVDASRVCIVGGSYGGYAALMGLVKTPELYRCAVSFAGVTDLPDLIAHLDNYFGGSEAAKLVFGSYWGDRERLRATSPARQADRIRAPVLLVHGTADRAVPVAQSRDMAQALRQAGRPVRYVEQEGGDHNLSSWGQRAQFFRELESFLDEQLKPQPTAVPAAPTAPAPR